MSNSNTDKSNLKLDTYCGFVALIGRPNVGKSTLLNQMLGQKLSITSSKPQTTRHRILGIETRKHVQYVFVDTPGIHHKQEKAINHIMNKTASSTLGDVDLIFFIVEACQWREDDDLVLKRLQNTNTPVICVVNKIDKIKDKQTLLPYLESLSKRFPFQEILPVSAKTASGTEKLMDLAKSWMPKGPFFYSESQVTDKSMRFIASEFIREKLFRLCGQEIPYSITVDIEQFEDSEKLCKIAATILVEKPSQKRIIIGKSGAKLKEVGKQARINLENMMDKKVYLQLWVKVKAGWADDERALLSLGYHDTF